MKWIVAAISLLTLMSPARAGLIHWGISNTSAQAGQYAVTGSSQVFDTEPWHTQSFTPISGFTSPILISPIPPDGPTLTSELTITDLASGATSKLILPIRFYDNEPVPEGEMDQHVVALGAFDPRILILGNHRYAVTGDSTNVYVTVAETPEPSTLALGSIGTLWIAIRRKRNVHI